MKCIAAETCQQYHPLIFMSTELNHLVLPDSVKVVLIKVCKEFLSNSKSPSSHLFGKIKKQRIRFINFSMIYVIVKGFF